MKPITTTMTDDELRALVASLAVQGKKTDKRIDAFAAQSKKTIADLVARSKKTDAQIEKVSKQLGGIDTNLGYHAEQFFQDAFREKLEFGKIKYDEMIPNWAHKTNNVSVEIDIVLLNGDSMALIEVKNRIHPDFVKEFAEKRIATFRRCFPKYKGYHIYLGIAGFSFSTEVLREADKYGVGIIRQVGEGVEVSADNLKMY
jgi:hypothetical protein